MYQAYILSPQVVALRTHNPYELHRSRRTETTECARSLVRSGQAPYRRQVARFAINLLPDLCPCSTLASKFIAATAALAMVAATLDESSAPNSDSRSRSPFWALVLSAGETGPLADSLFQRVGCLQGKQPAAPTAGCVCVCPARERVPSSMSHCLTACVCVRVTELNYRCRELAPRSRLDGILCDFCRKLISLRLTLAFSYTPTHTHSVAH